MRGTSHRSEAGRRGGDYWLKYAVKRAGPEKNKTGSAFYTTSKNLFPI